MRRWLYLVPRLACAIACVVVILIAEPLLVLLADRRHDRGT
ncbi:MAG TPA: hypothetical protein VIU64_17565 [Polyangia bacterium]